MVEKDPRYSGSISCSCQHINMNSQAQGNLTSWMMICAHRSAPHSPILLATTPTTRYEAAHTGFRSIQKSATVTLKHIVCQLRNQIPARTAPSLFMISGASQVADISTTTLALRMQPIFVEV